MFINVSVAYVPIIRRNNCIHGTLGTCYSVWMTVWYAGWNFTRINTVVSPDDGHIVARNMQRKEINILRKIVHQVGFIYKIIQGCTVNKTYNSVYNTLLYEGVTVIRNFFLHNFLVRDSAILPHMSESFVFSNSPIQIGHKQTVRANGLTKECRHEHRYFRKSLLVECAVDSRPHLCVFYQTSSPAEPMACLVSMPFPGFWSTS